MYLFLNFAAIAVVWSLGAGAAAGQTYPAKPVRIVIGLSAGGGTDVLTRVIAQRLTEAWGQNVIVENRPGASGFIAGELVAKSPPDGYTLIMGAQSGLAVAPALLLFRRIRTDFDTHAEEQLAGNGCETLDAPISGGYLAAAQGNLSVMAGGAAQTLERARPVLSAFARSITRAGDIGAGQTAKLAHQLVCSVNVMTLLEGMALGVAGGVEPAILRQILGEGIADSAVLRLWDDLGPRWKGMLAATPPGVTPPNLRKDLHLVLEYARELGINLYVGTQASLIADSGIASGRDDPRL